MIIQFEDGAEWGYEALEEGVQLVERTLRAHGCTPGSVVGMAYDNNSAAALAALIASWRSGFTPLFIPSSLSGPEIAVVADRARIRLALAGENVDTSKLGDLECVTIEPKPSHSTRQSSIAELLRSALLAQGGTNSALLLVTSGTTGHPKIVDLTFGALRYRLQQNTEALGSSILRRVLCLLPLHFGHGLIGCALTPLYAGGSIVLASDRLQVASSFWDLVEDQKISFASAVPSFWQLMIQLSRPHGNALGSICTIGCGSAPMTHRLASTLHSLFGDRRVLNLYGLTEMANWVAGGWVDSRRQDPGFVGQCWGGEAAVLLKDGSIASSGEGELVLRSPAMMRGYLADSERTEQALLAGWLRTGDRGYMSPSRDIYVKGRIVDDINVGGINIDPSSVDVALIAHEDVVDACCFPIADQLHGERVAAAVVLKEHSGITPGELAEWAAARVRKEAVPSEWHFVKAIPRNERGKVVRRMMATQIGIEL